MKSKTYSLAGTVLLLDLPSLAATAITHAARKEEARQLIGAALTLNSKHVEARKFLATLD